jgi:hypothetical protein
MAKISLFEHLNNTSYAKKEFQETDEGSKGYVPFVIDNYVATQNRLLPLVNAININVPISKKAHHDYFMHCLPKEKAFFKYPKVIKKYKNELPYLMRYFNVGEDEAVELADELKEGEVALIVDYYTKESKKR